MKIWILTKPSSFQRYANQRFLEEAKQKNIDLELVSEDEFEIILQESGEKSILRKGEKTEMPDALFSRSGAFTTYFQIALVRHFEDRGVFVLNSANSIENAKDKLHCLQMLSQKNLPIPKTMLGKFPINYEAIKTAFRYPIIMKKVSGAQGKGVFLIRNQEKMEEIEELLSDTERKFNFIFQEYVKTSHGKDVRVWVLGGRAIGAMKRIAEKGFRANYSSGGRVEKFELTPEVEWLAIESANTLGLKVAGVDLLFTKNGFAICEVNSNPGFQGFEEATGINIPHEIFHFLSLHL